MRLDHLRSGRRPRRIRRHWLAAGALAACWPTLPVTMTARAQSLDLPPLSLPASTPAQAAPASAPPASVPPVVTSVPAQAPPATTGAPARVLPPGLNFANGLLARRQYELAAEEYEKFLRTNPVGRDKADALYGLARAKLFLLKYGEARTHLQAFLETDPQHPNAATAQFRLGEAAYLMRDLPAAREALEGFLQQHPEHAHLDAALPYLGDVKLGLGDLKGAREAYETALNRYPDGPMADRTRFYLARVMAAQGRADEASQLLQKVAARPNSEWAERARVQLGLSQAAAGKHDEAIAAFSALEAANPQSSSAAEARLLRAESLVALKRPDDAEALLVPLVNDKSTPWAIAARASYDLGGLWLDARNQPEKALEVWDAALVRFTSGPTTPLLLFRSAEALAKLDRTAEARARYVKLAEEHPRDAWADRALVAAARLALLDPKTPEPEVARTLAAELLTKYPTSRLRPEARLIEARALQDLNRHAEAIPLLVAVLDEDRPEPELAQAARSYLSRSYKATNQPEKAAELLVEMAKAPAAPFASNARYSLGQARFEAGNYAEAVEPLTQYLEAEPRGEFAAHALAYLVIARSELGQTTEAEAAYQTLAADWPTSEDLVRVRLRLGETALKAKQFTQAAELFRPIADGPPSAWTAQARSGLGWALLGAGQPAQAAESFGGALAADPKGKFAAESAYLKGLALERAGQNDAALAAYAESETTHTGTSQAAASLLARARLLARMGRPGDAADAFDQYLKLTPAETSERDAALAEAAWALRDAGRKDAADAAFKQLFASYSSSPRAARVRVDLARLAYREKEAASAEELLAPFVADDASLPSDPEAARDALELLGRLRFDRGDWAEARVAFARLVEALPETDPRRETAKFWHAEAAFRADDPATAEPVFAALASQAAPEAPAWRSTAWLRRIQCLVALKRWNEAISEANALSTKLPGFPQMPEVHYARGRALQSQAVPRFDEARADYEAAISAGPATELAARSQLMIGETYFFERKYRDAEREFLKLDLTYDAPRWQAASRLELGKVYEAQGRWSDAVVTYRKLLDQFPNDPAATEARKQLDLAQARVGTQVGR